MNRIAASASEGGLETLELVDGEANSRLTLVPERGGMATRFRIGNKEVFYLDVDTLADESANVRGGNPVLFPSPGRLAGDAWAHAGHAGKLGQHGFARKVPWHVTDTATATAAVATLRLSTSAETRALWPWEFDLDCTYTLKGTAVRIDVTLTNRGTEAMPFAFGFHPYFHVVNEEKPGARVETRATRAWDNIAKREIRLERLSFGGPEVDLHLLDHGSSRSALNWQNDRITVEASPEFKRWVIWSVPGKPFICLEPWTSPFDALNSGDELLEVAAGAQKALYVQYTADVKQIPAPRRY